MQAIFLLIILATATATYIETTERMLSTKYEPHECYDYKKCNESYIETGPQCTYSELHNLYTNLYNSTSYNILDVGTCFIPHYCSETEKVCEKCKSCGIDSDCVNICITPNHKDRATATLRNCVMKCGYEQTTDCHCKPKCYLTKLCNTQLTTCLNMMAQIGFISQQNLTQVTTNNLNYSCPFGQTDTTCYDQGYATLTPKLRKLYYDNNNPHNYSFTNPIHPSSATTLRASIQLLWIFLATCLTISLSVNSL